MKLTWIFLLFVVLIYLFVYEPVDSWRRRRFRVRVRVRPHRFVRHFRRFGYRFNRAIYRVARRIGRVAHRIGRVRIHRPKLRFRFRKMADKWSRYTYRPKPGTEDGCDQGNKCPSICMIMCPACNYRYRWYCRPRCNWQCSTTCDIFKDDELRNPLPFPGKVSAIKCSFTEYDRDSDGVLSARELALPTNQWFNTANNRWFFKLLDENNDWTIDKNEFEKRYYICES